MLEGLVTECYCVKARAALKELCRELGDGQSYGLAHPRLPAEEDGITKPHPLHYGLHLECKLCGGSERILTQEGQTLLEVMRQYPRP